MSGETAGERGESLDEVLGFHGYEQLSEDRFVMRMPVTPAVLQPFGIVHGGSYAALAESLCSRATYAAVEPENIAMGQVNETAFLRAIRAGEVVAEAEAVHRGRTSWVWNVEMRDGDGRMCATSRLIIAVRPMRDSS
jgi:1,4-dihydroxy-2-naphthoyl-CoA hydrolase